LKKPNRYYLAYGSNLNIGQMRFRCPGAKLKGTGYIDGYRLLFKGSKTGAYLTIEKAEGCRVPVGVWTVTEEDEKNLDRYEGFPSFYYKKDFRISVTSDGQGQRVLNTFAYIMHEERELGIPAQTYIDTCVEGYEDFGFDIAFLQKALDDSRKGYRWWK